jgi:hypothetical protein
LVTIELFVRKNERRKQSKRKSSKEHNKSLSLITKALCGIGRGFDHFGVSCIECLALVSSWKVENLDDMNGGGWGCIYSHQPLPSRCSFLPTTDGPLSWSGRSAPADQRLKTQRSAVTAISTAILQLMRRQMSDKASRRRSGRAPRTVREDAIIHFTEPVTFGFFGSSPTGRSAPEAGRSARCLGRCLLFHRTVRSRDMCFCIGSV